MGKYSNSTVKMQSIAEWVEALEKWTAGEITIEIKPRLGQEVLHMEVHILLLVPSPDAHTGGTLLAYDGGFVGGHDGQLEAELLKGLWVLDREASLAWRQLGIPMPA